MKQPPIFKIKIKEVLDTLCASGKLTILVGIYMRDDKFTTTSGIVNLHPTKGTHWVMFVNEFYFDSIGCPPPLNITKQINNGIYSEYQIRKTIVIVQHIVCMCYISQI